MAALQYVDVPQYSAIIFRRTYTDLDLPGNIMDRAKAWLAPYKEVQWNEKRHQFTFPSGARLTFGYLETAADVRRYMGSEFQYIGFDELTQIPMRPYQMLYSRLRKTKDMDVPLRVRGASNPGDIGAPWVKERFGIGKDAKHKNPKGRIFIKATVYDNPSVDAEEYINESLSELDPITKARLLAGDWDVSDKGGMFQRDWFEIVSPGEFRARNIRIVKLCRVWDTAGTIPTAKNPDPDWTAGVKIGIDTAGHYWILSVVRKRDTPKKIDDFIVQTAAWDKKMHGHSCVQVVKREPADAGIRMATDQRILLADHQVVVVKDTKNKHLVARTASNFAQSGLISIVRGPSIPDFLYEGDAFSPDSRAHDDMIDAMVTGFNWLKGRGNFNFGAVGETEIVPVTQGGIIVSEDIQAMNRFITADGSKWAAS